VVLCVARYVIHRRIHTATKHALRGSDELVAQLRSQLKVAEGQSIRSLGLQDPLVQTLTDFSRVCSHHRRCVTAAAAAAAAAAVAIQFGVCVRILCISIDSLYSLCVG